MTYFQANFNKIWHIYSVKECQCIHNYRFLIFYSFIFSQLKNINREFIMCLLLYLFSYKTEFEKFNYNFVLNSLFPSKKS